jgi:Fe-S cluster biogenesis protein NfuA
MLESDLDLGVEVQRYLNSTIRPLLNIDAGDAEILSVTEGHVRIALLGSCSRCMFKASCVNYTILDRLESHFAGRPDATFEVVDVVTNRQAARLVSAEEGTQ